MTSVNQNISNSVTLVSGSPNVMSSSRRIGALILDKLSERKFETNIIDLSTLNSEALLGRKDDADVSSALEKVDEARIIVITSPIYRATYTGLLKVFFDLMPQGGLTGKICVPVATGGGNMHQLAVDHGLRPLVASLEGLTVANAIFATSNDLTEDTPSDALRNMLDNVMYELDALI
ncbi:MAG: FMN reductase (NADPH) [Chloroflexi bacterium]|nr:FMN reductase (NADPH) [Chloroflexota bacterium]|tara:strand:- start:161 stop:691 length:531 start_codon:yes stop_codon:yes gene_type:complete